MELKTFYDNFDLLADAPNCISKLREMILHLAVQGKLVPQDPDDEPSKAFISKIKNEVPCRKNGKKRTLCDPIKEKDEPYQLPSGWTWERFGNVFDIQGGTQPPKSQFKDRPSQSHVRLYQIRDFGSKPVPIYVPRSSVKSFCSKDDVMLARYGASVGKIFMGEDGAYNVALTKVYFNHKGIFNRYVYFMLKSPLFQVPILSFSRSAQAGFNKGNIFPIILPFPPTNEQKRIVAKIEELMTLCDDMEARKQKAHYACIKVNDASINKLVSESTSNKFNKHWNRIHRNFNLLYSKPENINKLRQAILQLAVQGKLVPQNPNDEPASVLLEKVRIEQKRKIKEFKLRKTKPIKPFTSDDIPTSIPSGWGCERFGNMALISGGVTKGRKFAGRETGYYPYLRVANVQRWYLDLNEVKEIEIPVDELDKYKLEYDDILITEGGDWDKVGRAAVWEGQIKTCLHQNHIFKARLSCDDIEKKWILLFINSPVGREYFENSSKQTTNLASINMTQLKHCPVYIPPVNEQRRIINKVDELLSLCDDLELKLNEGESHSNRLIDAVVSNLVAA